MSDRALGALAAAAVTGALASVLLPWWVVGLLAIAALGSRSMPQRMWLLVAVVLALTSTLGGRAVAGLAPPPPGPLAGVVTLVADPQPQLGGVTATVSHRGRRYEAGAWGAPAGTIGRALAGERLVLEGDVQRGEVPAWLARRHVVARLAVRHAEPGPPGAPLARAAASVHRLLARSAGAMGQQGPLYRGLVVGDDRDQPPELRDAFRAAGLSHLTAVSGQNVAFALAVASPLLERLPRRARTAAALMVLAGFVVLTRAEPSVLRATSMAAVAAVGAANGHRRGALRALCASVVLVLLVDPLLVRSVGLWLSVVATGGIVVLAPPIAARVGGPRWLGLVIAVPLSAQLATAPLLVAAFGSVPLVALPANLAAAPVAGPIMMWGLSGGLLAGVLGGSAATVLQAPARLGVRWLEIVAGAAAGVPVGSLRAAHVVAIAAVVACTAGPWAGPATRRAGVLAVLAVVALAAFGTPAGGSTGAG